MSDFVNTHSLERAINKLAVKNVLGLDARRRAAQYNSLQEISHQFQVPVSGIARALVGWDKFHIPFDVYFVWAPNQRDSPLAVPHFHWGAVLKGEPSPDPAVPDPNNPDSHVHVTCHVSDWIKDKRTDDIVGAELGVGCSTLGGRDVAFTGYVHMTFQGYGAPQDDTSTSLGPSEAT